MTKAKEPDVVTEDPFVQSLLEKVHVTYMAAHTPQVMDKKEKYIHLLEKQKEYLRLAAEGKPLTTVGKHGTAKARVWFTLGPGGQVILKLRDGKAYLKRIPGKEGNSLVFHNADEAIEWISQLQEAIRRNPDAVRKAFGFTCF